MLQEKLMASKNNSDLTQTPVSALKKPTLTVLSTSLNPPKVIPSPDGLPRDWRGLAHLFGLTSAETIQLAAMPDPLFSLLIQWGSKKNVNNLKEYLCAIDRYDVLDDIAKLLEKDCLDFIEQMKNVNINTSNNNIHLEADRMILTRDDVARLEKGLEPQIYDAYVLYAEQDSEFAAEIVETMENKYHFKFCVRDRDLIGGVQFEHDAITKLIAERCRRLVVIVSSNFLKSKANKFFVTFAQALGIDIRERKVIPILYERCDVPPELSYYFLLDYNRAGKLWNFWDKLRDSIQAPDVSSSSIIPLRKPSPNPSGNFWISRTHFETEQKECSESISELSETKSRNKTPNVYKMIKNSLSKNKKNSNSEDSETKQIETTSLLNNLPSLVSNDDVPFEKFENSSSFETKDENSKTSEKNKNVKKKKWFKKKTPEALLS